MLQVQRVRDTQEKSNLFGQADPARDCWIVSDLQSKWHLQREWLAQYGALEQTSVLRAGELWKHFAFQVRPDLRLLSMELAQTLIWNMVEPKRLPWLRSPQSVGVILKQMQMWVSVFGNEGYKELMAEWFTANPDAYVRWGHWFELCSELWESFHEKNLILAPWLPGVLLNEDLSALKWEKNLIFDLGAQISLVEGQLVQQLAQHFDITVLYPEAPWLALMPETLRPYRDLLEEPYAGDSQWQPPVGGHLAFGRFSTQLAEVKDAVAQVRIWLDAGVPASAIGLVLPDVEDAWPVLKMYFDQEGIPVNKTETSKLGGFTDMSRWIAILRTRLKRVKSADLEMSLFVSASAPGMPVHEFRRLFSNVYDERDLERAESLFARGEVDSTQPLRLPDFLAWALGFWPGTASDRLESLFGVIGQEVPDELELPADQWLNYVEGLLARREVSLKAANEKGVWCISLSSAHWLPLTHAVFMNLNEGSMRNVERSPVSPLDAGRILQDTGFALGSNDNQQMEFELIWFLQREWSELRLTFAASDFQGGVLTPSRLWLWAAILNDQFKKEPEAPRSTRWDEIQHLRLKNWMEFTKLPVDRIEDLDSALARERDGLVSTFAKSAELSFSASSLTDYWKCPFIFAAKKRFRQADDPALDLDMDPMSRGSLLHAILEALTVEPVRFDYTDNELSECIEKVRAEKKILLGDERLWPAIRNQHLRFVKMFLSVEKDWRERFPHTKTVGREVEVEGYWDVGLGGPVAEPTAIRFRGRLDRVDADSQGRYALIDYKASARELTSWKSWLENRQVQMPFYAMLLESGFAKLPPAEVTAANFYVVRDQDRGRGFFVKDASAELYSCEDRRQNYITPEQKQELFAQLKSELSTAIVEITAGRLNPNPKNFKACDPCSWRKQCRAPHLN